MWKPAFDEIAVVEGRTVWRLNRTLLRDRPYELWNSFLRLMSFGPVDRFDEIQRVAYVANYYDGQVQNGGHLQYFVNSGDQIVGELLEALRAINANTQLEIATEAIHRWNSKPRVRTMSVERFVEEARQEEFLDLDHKYYELSPSTADRLEEWLRSHVAHFVEIIEEVR